MRRNGGMRGSDGWRPLRHGIVAARMPRMAAADASHREPRAARCAMALDGFACVIRATRIETAIRAEQRAKQVLVGGERREQQSSHRYPQRRASNCRDSVLAATMSALCTVR